MHFSFKPSLLVWKTVFKEQHVWCLKDREIALKELGTYHLGSYNFYSLAYLLLVLLKSLFDFVFTGSLLPVQFGLYQIFCTEGFLLQVLYGNPYFFSHCFNFTVFLFFLVFKKLSLWKITFWELVFHELDSGPFTAEFHSSRY